MPRKKKSESLDDLLIQESAIQNPASKEIQEESEEKEVAETVQKEADQNLHSNAGSEEISLDNTDNQEKTVAESLEKDTLEVSETEKDQDVKDVEESFENPEGIGIPKEFLAEQEKIQKETDKEIQTQREKSEKPDLEKDVMSFEDFQKSTIEQPVNKPFLIPLSKASNCKYSVGINTRRGCRIIAHKLSKEKAENYIENFLKQVVSN